MYSIYNYYIQLTLAVKNIWNIPCKIMNILKQTDISVDNLLYVSDRALQATEIDIQMKLAA